uniref:Uncharacterized protein n=1 Tax=Amphiprion ocellaris TaxID=80972 RepID=A0AAQ5ZD55_AMPOC
GTCPLEGFFLHVTQQHRTNGSFTCRKDTPSGHTALDVVVCVTLVLLFVVACVTLVLLLCFQKGIVQPMSVKVGEKVLLPEYGGTKVVLEDKDYFLFRDADILGKYVD